MADQYCGYCGDGYNVPPGHDCWLAKKYSNQETLEGPVPTEYLSVQGIEPEDSHIPERVRQVNISIL